MGRGQITGGQGCKFWWVLALPRHPEQRSARPGTVGWQLVQTGPRGWTRKKSKSKSGLQPVSEKDEQFEHAQTHSAVQLFPQCMLPVACYSPSLGLPMNAVRAQGGQHDPPTGVSVRSGQLVLVALLRCGA